MPPLPELDSLPGVVCLTQWGSLVLAGMVCEVNKAPWFTVPTVHTEGDAAEPVHEFTLRHPKFPQVGAVTIRSPDSSEWAEMIQQVRNPSPSLRTVKAQCT